MDSYAANGASRGVERRNRVGGAEKGAPETQYGEEMASWAPSQWVEQGDARGSLSWEVWSR